MYIYINSIIYILYIYIYINSTPSGCYLYIYCIYINSAPSGHYLYMYCIYINSAPTGRYLYVRLRAHCPLCDPLGRLKIIEISWYFGNRLYLVFSNYILNFIKIGRFWIFTGVFNPFFRPLIEMECKFDAAHCLSRKILH